MRLFRKPEKEKPLLADFPAQDYEPVIRCSICTGEQVACMRRRDGGKLREVMLLRTQEDLDRFALAAGVSPESIPRIY